MSIPSYQPIVHGTAIIGDILEQVTKCNPALVEMIFSCSVLRWFDTQVVAGMRAPNIDIVVSDVDLLSQIVELPLCESYPNRSETWQFYDDARAYLLTRKEVTGRWPELNARAVATFERMLKAKNLEGDDRFNDLDWCDYIIEWVYHHICLNPSAGLEEVRRICAEAIAAWQYSFCSEFLGGIGQPPGSEPIATAIDDLKKSITALLNYNNVKALPILNSLVSIPGLTPAERSNLHYLIGTTLLDNQSCLAPALHHLQEARQLAPENPAILVELAAVHYLPGPMLGRIDLARKYADDARKLDPISGCIATGRIHEQLEEWDAAIEQYRLAVQEAKQQGNRDIIDHYLALSEAYAARRKKVSDVDKAIAAIDEAIAKAGSHYFALIRKGAVYHGVRRYKDAGEAYQQAKQDSPSQKEAFLSTGRLLVATGKSARAEDEYHEAIKREPAAVEGYYALANLYDQRGDYDKAIQVCNEAFTKSYPTVDLYLLLSSLYVKQKRWQEFEHTLLKDLTTFDSERHYEALCRVGNAYLERARRRRNGPERTRLLAEARVKIEAALSLDLQRAWAYISLADLAVLQNDRNAVKQLEQQLDEHAPWARYEMLVNVGRAYLNSYDDAAAEQILTDATTLAPYRQAAWYGLAELYDRQGQPAQVANDWARLVRNDRSLRYAARINVGMAFENAADYEHARSNYKRAQAIEPETADAFLRLGDLDFEGKKKEAITQYQLAAEKASDVAAVAYSRISAIHRRQKNYPEAEKNYPEAEKFARVAILSDPEQHNGYVELALLGMAQENNGLIEEARTRLASKVPFQTYELEHALGNAYYAEDYGPRDPHKAEKAFKRCIEIDPERTEAYVGLARLLVEQQRYPEAHTYLNIVLDLDYANVDAYIVLGSLLNKEGKSADANNAYQDAKMYAHISFLALGRYYEWQQNTDAALEVYRLSIKLDEGVLTYDAYLSLGILQGAQGQIEEAAQAYRQACATEPQQPEAYVQLMQLYADQQQWSDALAVAQQMAQQPPLAYDAYLNLGDLYAAQGGHFEEAAQAYRQAQARDPQRIDAYLNLAALYQESGARAQAEQPLNQALEVAPKALAQLEPAIASDSYRRLGDLLYHQQRYANAAEALRQAVARDPSNARAYCSLGLTYEQQGTLKQAEEALSRAVDLAPNREAYVALGRIYGKQGDVSSISRMARQIFALDLTEDDRYLGHLDIAGAYQEGRFYEWANEEIGKAIASAPGRVEAYIWQGWIYEAQQRRAEAREVYRKIGELNPDLLPDVLLSIR